MTRLPNKKIGIGVCVGVLLIGHTASADDGHPAFEKRHRIAVGAFQQDMSARITAQRGNFEPVAVDLTDVGVDDQDTSWMLEYHYRLSDKWSLSAAAYRWADAGERTTERSFNFDGNEYVAGASIAADLQIDTYILDAMYSVYSTESTRVALGAGLHMFDLSATIAGAVSVEQSFAETRSESRATLLAPLPNLRASAVHAFNDRVAVSAVAGWLSANIDDFSGDFVYAFLRGHYHIGNGFGLALGYQLVDVDVTEQVRFGFNEYDIQFDGPTVEIMYSF